MRLSRRALLASAAGAVTVPTLARGQETADSTQAWKRRYAVGRETTAEFRRALALDAGTALAVGTLDRPGTTAREPTTPWLVTVDTGAGRVIEERLLDGRSLLLRDAARTTDGNLLLLGVDPDDERPRVCHVRQDGVDWAVRPFTTGELASDVDEFWELSLFALTDDTAVVVAGAPVPRSETVLLRGLGVADGSRRWATALADPDPAAGRGDYASGAVSASGTVAVAWSSASNGLGESEDEVGYREVDAAGEVVRSVDRSGEPRSLVTADARGYLVSGEVGACEKGRSTLSLGRLDRPFDVQWTRRYDLPVATDVEYPDVRSLDATLTSDGGVAVVRRLEGGPVRVLKLAADGRREWATSVTFPRYERASPDYRVHSIVEARPGAYLLCGEAVAADFEEYLPTDGWLVALVEDGAATVTTSTPTGTPTSDATETTDTTVPPTESTTPGTRVADDTATSMPGFGVGGVVAGGAALLGGYRWLGEDEQE